MKMSKREYQEMSDKMAKKSPLLVDIIKAFVIGGAICVLGEMIFEMYKHLSIEHTSAQALTSVTLIALSALFTGLGLYNKLAKHAGAGTLVPITGFANAIVSAALEFKSEGFILGMCAKMFSLAGPVLVMGTSVSVLYGLICLFFM